MTRALYAYAMLALDKESNFEQALARTFAAPEVYSPDAPATSFDDLYHRYRQLAEFADQSLSH